MIDCTGLPREPVELKFDRYRLRAISFLLVRLAVLGSVQDGPHARREAATTVSQYEITYIVRPLLEDPQVDEVAAHFSDVAKQNGGEDIGAERMGKRRLAYEIHKVREGHYVCMKFKGAAACADEVMRQMRLHENILRALVVRV